MIVCSILRRIVQCAALSFDLNFCFYHTPVFFLFVLPLVLPVIQLGSDWRSGVAFMRYRNSLAGQAEFNHRTRCKAEKRM